MLQSNRKRDRDEPAQDAYRNVDPGHGYHPAAWRHPDVPADGTLQVEHYVRSAQSAERGKLDMIFFADGAGIRQGDNPPGSLARLVGT